MDRRLMGMLVCPVCKGPLKYDREAAELLCFADAMAYQVRDGIPVMLEDQARPMTAEEKEARR